MFGYSITAINEKKFMLQTNLSWRYAQCKMKKMRWSKYQHAKVGKNFSGFNGSFFGIEIKLFKC